MIFSHQGLLGTDELTKAIQVFAGKLRIQIFLIKGFYKVMIPSEPDSVNFFFLLQLFCGSFYANPLIAEGKLVAEVGFIFRAKGSAFQALPGKRRHLGQITVFCF